MTSPTRTDLRFPSMSIQLNLYTAVCLPIYSKCTSRWSRFILVKGFEVVAEVVVVVEGQDDRECHVDYLIILNYSLFLRLAT